jgi:hypothetical protein
MNWQFESFTKLDERGFIILLSLLFLGSFHVSFKIFTECSSVHFHAKDDVT